MGSFGLVRRMDSIALTGTGLKTIILYLATRDSYPMVSYHRLYRMTGIIYGSPRRKGFFISIQRPIIQEFSNRILVTAELLGIITARLYIWIQPSFPGSIPMTDSIISLTAFTMKEQTRGSWPIPISPKKKPMCIPTL